MGNTYAILEHILHLYRKSIHLNSCQFRKHLDAFKVFTGSYGGENIKGGRRLNE